MPKQVLYQVSYSPSSSPYFPISVCISFSLLHRWSPLSLAIPYHLSSRIIFLVFLPTAPSHFKMLKSDPSVTVELKGLQIQMSGPISPPELELFS